MTSSMSPRAVFVLAWKLGCASLPEYSSFYSRKDFTLPQLFACLVLRDFLKLSYRRTAAFLRDVPDWCAEVEMERPPHHKTINDAFDRLTELGVLNDMLDRLARHFAERGVLKLDEKPLAVDSTYFESHHVSRHFEKRREKAERKKAGKAGLPRDAQESATRSKTVKGLPKMVVAIASACHVVLAVSTATGMGGDQNCLHDVLFDAWRRADVTCVVADAGFDSEENRRLATLDMGLACLIPPDSGRPTEKMPPTPLRAEARVMFDAGLGRDVYGQRWQSETGNSMLKRNYGSALKARTPGRREREMFLRAITHNLALPPHPYSV